MTVTPSDRRPSRRSVLAGAAAVLGFGLTSTFPLRPAHAASAAENFIQGTGTTILGIVGGGGSNGTKKNKFFDLLWSRAARQQITVFSVGSYRSQYNALSGSQKSELTKLVMKFVAGVFIRYINEFSGNRFEVTGSQVRSASDIIVRSKVHFPDGRTPLEVQWRVTKSGGAHKVFDVRVAGVWLALQQKSEFESIIRSNGGQVTGLITYLRSNA